MGQYFKPAIKTTSGKQFSIARSGFSKMMEWGYLFNSGMMCVLSALQSLTANGNTVTYYHAGDYSDKIDAYGWDEGNIDISQDSVTLDNDEAAFDKTCETTLTLILYNHTKKEMVSLKNYYDYGLGCESGEDDKEWAIHPLALLCCTEQGLGGGDYRGLFRGKELNEGGDWFGDEISVSDEVKVGFTDITDTLITSTSLDERDLKRASIVQPFVIDESAFGPY